MAVKVITECGVLIPLTGVALRADEDQDVHRCVLAQNHNGDHECACEQDPQRDYVKRLEDIVRRLAESDPLRIGFFTDSDGSEHNEHDCVHCNGSAHTCCGQRVKHDDDCIWLQARKAVGE